MIRGVKHMSIAVRAPDGNIVTRCKELTGLYTGSLRQLPFIRGVIVLWETMALGMQALMFSSVVSAAPAADDDELDQATSDKSLWLMVLLSVGLVAALFFAGPVLLTHWLEQFFPGDMVVIIEGILRVGLLIGYIAVIGRMESIQRVFSYHGAEHMAVHAWEHKLPLTVDRVRTFNPAHPRCGTAFLLTVMIISLVAFVAMGAVPFWARLLSRVILLPVVAGVAYEVIRFAARYEFSWWANFISSPNLLLQRLTTRHPDDDQIEVAITAMRVALEADGVLVEEPATEPLPALAAKPIAEYS
jgi:uncharacterized protein YqhQ